MLGSLMLTDDSVVGQIKDMSKGGLSVLLTRFDTAKAKLGIGSRVSVVLSGYKAKKKDAQGNRTGDEQWNWNAIAVKVILDLSTGTDVPNPEAPPAAPPNGARRVFSPRHPRYTRSADAVRRGRSAGLAQLVEQRFCKPKVAGSIPATGTTLECVTTDIPSIARSSQPATPDAIRGPPFHDPNGRWGRGAVDPGTA